MKITPREKRRHAEERESPFLAWGDFHTCSRFPHSTIPEEKWGTTCSLYSKLNECYLLSIELLQFCPPMILVLILNSYAFWRSNWYFHINFGKICEHFWQLLKLLKIASLTMEVKYVGTFLVILVKLVTSPLPPPKIVEFWAQWDETSLFDVTTLSGRGGGSWGMKRWTQSRSKNNIAVRSRVLCNNCLEGFFHCNGGSRGGAQGPPLFFTKLRPELPKKVWGTTPPPPPHVRIWMTRPPLYLKVWIRHCTVFQVLLTSIVAALSQHKTNCKRLSSVTQEKHARSSNKMWQANFLIQTPNQIKRQAWQYLNFRSGIVHMFLVLGWFGWVLSKG